MNIEHSYCRIFFISMIAALMGCGGSKDTLVSNQKPDAFIFARGSDAQKLDPADVDDGESVKTLAQICEGLVRFKQGSLEIEPWLAESYSVSEDGLSYTFKLRDGVYFHDGTPLDAEAALFSFHRQMDEQHSAHLPDATFAYWNYLFQDIAKVEAVDAMTLQITLSQPNSSILYSLATFPAWLISPKAMHVDLPRHPIGTGPYHFVDWKSGQSIILEKNDNYWGSPKPVFERLILKTVPDNAVRLLEFKSGKIHGLDGLQPAEAKALEGDASAQVYRRPGMNLGYMAINTDNPRFKDPRVRRALAMAIDRQAIADIALDGAGQPADYPLPPGFLGRDASAPVPFVHDPEQARHILQRYPDLWDEPWVISTFNAPRPYFPDPVKVASLIRDDLQALGLNVELETRDFKSHLHILRNGDFELGLIGWIGDNGDTDNFLSIFFGSWAAEKGVATNYSFFRNETMDTLLLKARRTTDPELRNNLYFQALKVWSEEMPLIPLVHAEQITVMRSEVDGFVQHPTGNVRLGAIDWRKP